MIEARLTIEMMGRPKKALQNALETVVKEIKEQNKVEKVHYSKPKKVGKTLFTAFTEFIVSVEDYGKLMGIIVDYIPTIVEILSPQNINIGMEELQDSLNDFVTMINGFDRQLKVAQSKNASLERELKEK